MEAILNLEDGEHLVYILSNSVVAYIGIILQFRGFQLCNPNWTVEFN